MLTTFFMTTLYTLLKFHFSWDDIGYYIGVSIAILIAAGFIEGVFMFMFKTDPKQKGIVETILDLIKDLFIFVFKKIVDLYYDIADAIENKRNKY